MRKSKEEKKKAKHIQKLRSTMDWMDIDSVDDNGIILKKDGKTMITKGIRVLPINIYLLPDAEKTARIMRYASALDKLYQSSLYIKCIKSKPDVTLQVSSYFKALETEENPAIANILELQIHKLEWFRELHREVNFYILIQDDELHIDKSYDMLKKEMISAFGSKDYIRNMNYSDYKSVIQQEFEHEYIDELLFTQTVLPNVSPLDLKMANEKIGEGLDEFEEK